MAVNREAYGMLRKELGEDVQVVAVSKTKPVEDIRELYDLGQRDFGENYVQELLEKAPLLPLDIRWHFIGHLQSNKVKYIVPFVHMIHGVDSEKLLKEIDKQAARDGRVIDCLLQIHIAREDTKFGLDAAELDAIVTAPSLLSELRHVRIMGLMGMASLSEDLEKVRHEFASLKQLFDQYFPLPGVGERPLLSMGMSGDYQMAIAEGSNMVRIGSLLFGNRNYM